jgi:hypothetical protein
MSNAPVSAGDDLPERCFVIEVHVPDAAHMFNAIDPSPFRERDLDPNAEEFIVGWARSAPRHAPLALVVHLDRPAGPAEEARILRDAVRENFRARAETQRQRLHRLLRIGRTSLAIGIFFLSATVALGGWAESLLASRRFGEIVRESLLIGGWVAMWRPLEIFLYDWWPIRDEARLLTRLSAMSVRVTYEPHPAPGESKNAREAELSRA